MIAFHGMAKMSILKVYICHLKKGYHRYRESQVHLPDKLKTDSEWNFSIANRQFDIS